jgi:gentisate 1,2-dioxygenase
MAQATQHTTAKQDEVNTFLAGLSQYHVGPLWKVLGKTFGPNSSVLVNW